MKQARGVVDGASRRAVEKTGGRNEAGEWDLPHPERGPQTHGGGVDVDEDAAKRGETRAGMVALTRGDREEGRRDFEEERKPERMNPDRIGRGTVDWSVLATVTET
jgi:hypothetical protein